MDNDKLKIIKELFFSKSGNVIPNRFNNTINLKYPGLFTDINKFTEFLPNNTKFAEICFCYVNELTEIPKCKICNKNVVKFSSFYKGYKTYCNECEPMHDINHINKINETKRKIGYENTVKRRQETMMNRYGKIHALQCNQFINKKDSTCEEKYGHKDYILSETGKNHIETVLMEKYGVKNFNQSHLGKEVIDKLNDKNWLETEYKTKFPEEIAKLLHPTLTAMTINSYLDFHNIPKNYNRNCSMKEKQVYEYVKSIYNGTIITNDRKILNGKELDIYIPDMNYAIEFNGDYYHYGDAAKNEKYYHFNKYLQCLDKNIELLHIKESDWDNYQNIIKETIYLRLNNFPYTFKSLLFLQKNDQYHINC